VRSSTNSDITILFWGESQTSNRAMLVTALANAIVSVTEREVPVTVEPVQLGSGEIASWSERLLPLLVLMSIVLGGTLIPAVSLVDEKQRRTLLALTTTPATLYDVLTAKAMLGIGVSLVMGVVILTLNRAFGSNPLMLVSVLGLGASTASIFGILLGTLVKDMNGLFTVIKSMAMLLYAPAIIEIIPQIPQWIAQFFPTYYLIAPIQAIALDGAQWSDVGGQVAVLVLLTLALLAVLVLSITRQQKRTAYAV
jgi:ABC-2 type transport system permease protein